MNITITRQANGVYKVIPDHPSFPAHVTGNIYLALDLAKAVRKGNEHLFDTIVISETPIFVG